MKVNLEEERTNLPQIDISMYPSLPSRALSLPLSWQFTMAFVNFQACGSSPSGSAFFSPAKTSDHPPPSVAVFATSTYS